MIRLDFIKSIFPNGLGGFWVGWLRKQRDTDLGGWGMGGDEHCQKIIFSTEHWASTQKQNKIHPQHQIIGLDQSLRSGHSICCS